MKYRAYATRTKTDKREVLVAESNEPIDRARLQEMLQLHSQEFDDTTVMRFEVEEGAAIQEPVS